MGRRNISLKKLKSSLEVHFKIKVWNPDSENNSYIDHLGGHMFCISTSFRVFVDFKREITVKGIKLTKKVKNSWKK